MTRVRKRLLTFLAVASLVLCATMSSLWLSRLPAPIAVTASVEQFYVLEGIALSNGACVAYFQDLRNGQMSIISAGSPFANGMIVEVNYTEVIYKSGAIQRSIPPRSNLLGVDVPYGAPRMTPAPKPLSIPPYGTLALLFSLPPLLWCVNFVLKRRTIRTGCCIVCGYDLRATPERCPECGSVPAEAGTATS